MGVFAELDTHVAQILEIQLVMPRHLGTAALRILTLAVLQIVILADVLPEVVALHVGSIDLSVDSTVVDEVPAVQFFARCRYIDEVAGCCGVAQHVGSEGVGEAGECQVCQVATLIAVVDEAERRSGILRFLQLVAGTDQQTIWSHIGGIARLVVIGSINRGSVVLVG